MTKSAPEIVDEIAVRMELVNACALAGGPELFAMEHGNIGGQYVADIIRGRRHIPIFLVRALGYEQVTRYVKVVVSSPGACLPGVGNSPASVGAFSSS